MKVNYKSLEEKISFIPFGSQYYRPPTPPMREWEEDFKRFRILGFNTAKIWIQWRWVEPKEGSYLYSDFDRLFDLAEQYQIKIVVNTILCCVPEWVYAKYPDCRIKDINRHIVWESGYRAMQVGGWRCCWDHPEAAKLSLRFLKKLVIRYKNRQSLLAWDVWNEASLGFCSCDNTHKVFTQWLKTNFGSIGKVNEFLGRRYVTFDEIPLPSSEDDINYPLMYLTYDFRTDRLKEQIKWRVQIVKEIDPDTPVMTHTGSPLHIRDSDNWKNAKVVDFYGTSIHQWSNIYLNPERASIWTNFPLCLDSLFAISPYNWVSELAAGSAHYGLTSLKHVHFILPEDIRMRTWTCIAHGTKGLLYWQFKPERLGPEAPGWGLINLDGSSTSRAHEAKEAATFVNQWKDFLLNARPPEAQVGILWDPKISYVCLMAGVHLDTNLYLDAIRGAYQALWWRDMPCRIVTPEDEWDGLSAICLPFPIHLHDNVAEKITSFVKEGGLILSEGGLGSYDARVRYSSMIPPGELSQVFGIVETETAEWQKKEVDFTTKVVIGKLRENHKCKGSSFIHKIKAQTAEPIATFPDGSGALFKNSYGKGWAYYLATHPCIYAARKWDLSTNELIGAILCLNCDERLPRLKEKDGMINMRILEKDSEKMLFVFNHENVPKRITILTDAEHKVKVLRGENPEVKNGEIKGVVGGINLSVYYLC